MRKAEEAARTDQNVLILSDRGVDENHAPIPALLAVAAVHNHLIRKVLRTEIGLILESGETSRSSSLLYIDRLWCNSYQPLLGS